jgi:hypothetical protein
VWCQPAPGEAGANASTRFSEPCRGTLDGHRKIYGASLETMAQTAQLGSRYNQNTQECENAATNILPVYVASEVLDITSEHPPPDTPR